MDPGAHSESATSVPPEDPDDPAEEDEASSEGPHDIPSDDEVEEEAPFRLPGAALRGAFPSLDVVNLTEEFEERASVMKSVPRFLRGPYRTAMRVALEEIREGGRRDDMTRQERGWKLFLLLQRMLLHRSPRGGLIPRAKLLDRRGRWIDLLTASEECCRQAAASRRRRTRRVEDEMKRRVDRADALVHMGELSSARQALEGATLAPGTEATLNALRDPAKRPPEPRPLCPENW